MLRIGIVIKNGLVEESFISGGNHNAELYIIDWDDINSGKKEAILGQEIQHVSQKRFSETIKEANEAIKENNEEF